MPSFPTSELEHEADAALAARILHSDAATEIKGCFGGVFIRQLVLARKGDYHQGHRHRRDHLTLISRGAVLCEIEGGEPKTIVAPAAFEVKAQIWHKITAIEENTLYYCIFAARADDDNNTYDEVAISPDEMRERIKVMRSPCDGCLEKC
jgi:quercetin dioxygenase-like cupin family protein